MAEETKKTPQTPEEIAREAQAQAMKAALEQAQALYGRSFIFLDRERG